MFSVKLLAVAILELDEDHGDLGTRIIGNVDVIGDGSTADAHSGHGLTLLVQFLETEARGGYAGVAPEANLFPSHGE